MLYQEMDVFTRREELLCISVYSVFTWKEKSQGISVDSTNDGNDGQSKVTFVTLFFEGLIYKY